MSEPILDFEAVACEEDATIARTGNGELAAHNARLALDAQARAYAERRVAEAVAPYRDLVEKVREWQQAYNAERKDAHIGLYSLLERRCLAEDALASLPLPEMTP
ncbi:MAG TPA: hypothetical protein VFI41_12540 [Gemmatimonadales bacterium]|nr:hypothetical protein [Gemmatimonadales bacterium]